MTEDEKKERKRRYRMLHPEIHRESSRRYYRKNRENILAQQRLYKAAHREEIREKSRAHMKEYYRSRCEVVKARARAWYAAHREEVLARQAARRTEDPEREREYRRRWRAAHPEREQAYLQRNRERAARHYQENREAILLRRKMVRDAAATDKPAVRETHRPAVVSQPVTARGRRCTECGYYLRRPQCRAEVFEATSTGLRFAETCLAYHPRLCRVVA